MNSKIEKIEKAYGGCRKCYGKGYSTVRYGEAEGDVLVSPVKTNLHFCTCLRGTQLKELWEQKPCCGHGCCCNKIAEDQEKLQQGFSYKPKK